MQRIEAPHNIRSLCWLDDQLIDWASGGQILRLDGTIGDPNVIYGYRFDAAVMSPCGEFAVIYEKLGTKGLVLNKGRVVREINRSFYHANVYEYPIAIFETQDGQTALVHCPEQYCRLEIEDIRTGEKLAKSDMREPGDFFHSRLRLALMGIGSSAPVGYGTPGTMLPCMTSTPRSGTAPPSINRGRYRALSAK